MAVLGTIFSHFTQLGIPMLYRRCLFYDEILRLIIMKPRKGDKI